VNKTFTEHDGDIWVRITRHRCHILWQSNIKFVLLHIWLYMNIWQGNDRWKEIS